MRQQGAKNSRQKAESRSRRQKAEGRGRSRDRFTIYHLTFVISHFVSDPRKVVMNHQWKMSMENLNGKQIINGKWKMKNEKWKIRSPAWPCLLLPAPASCACLLPLALTASEKLSGSLSGRRAPSHEHRAPGDTLRLLGYLYRSRLF